MLLAVSPLPRILASVRPTDLSVAMLLVESVLPLIDFASLLRPLEDALAMHHVVAPFSFVASSIRPGILAKPNDVVIPKLPLILGMVCPNEFALVSMLFACNIAS